MHEPRSILITGASSGIGEALALAYAAPGRHLALSGRSEARLAVVADAARAAGAMVDAATLDVRDADAMRDWIARIDGTHPLDLVVANAGISSGMPGGRIDEATIRGLFATNIDGVLNTLHPAIAAMRPRRRGQLAIVASLAGFRGLPTAPAYAASKAAVRVYGEAMRPLLAADGLALSVVCPGFVDSRMTAANRFPMPFKMTAERAARIILRGLERNRARIAFPLPMAALVWLLAALPPALTDLAIRRLPEKD